MFWASRPAMASGRASHGSNVARSFTVQSLSLSQLQSCVTTFGRSLGLRRQGRLGGSYLEVTEFN